MTNKEWKRLSLCLDPKDYQKLRVVAAKEGVSMSDLLRKWILDYLNVNKSNPNPGKREQL